MAKFERLEPRADNMPIFDGGTDEDDGEEGSRLPLLIVIALLVLAAFAGVVWLAYTQGVERGRADSPRVIVAQGNSGTKLKVFEQPAPPDDASSDADSVPPPPTPVDKTPPVQAPPDLRPATTPMPSSGIPAQQAPSTPAPALPSPAKKAPPIKGATTTAPAQPSLATHAPAPLTASGQYPSGQSESAEAAPGDTEATSPPPPTSASTEQGANPAASGSYRLQIGSYKSQDDAEAAWRAFQGKHPVVGGYRSDIKQVDLGDKGTWYRLRIGSFADKDAAATLCSKLKADGASCLIAK